MSEKEEAKKEEAAEVATSDTGKKWYKSTTIQATIAAVVVLVLLPRLGIEVPADYTTEVYTALASAVIVGLRKASGSLSL